MGAPRVSVTVASAFAAAAVLLLAGPAGAADQATSPAKIVPQPNPTVSPDAPPPPEAPPAARAVAAPSSEAQGDSATPPGSHLMDGAPTERLPPAAPAQ